VLEGNQETVKQAAALCSEVGLLLDRLSEQLNNVERLLLVGSEEPFDEGAEVADLSHDCPSVHDLRS